MPTFLASLLPDGRYGCSACARLASGSVCSQMRPGPVSAARKMHPRQEHIANALNARDLKVHTGLKSTNVAGMHPQRLARLQVARDYFAAQFEPCRAQAAELLQKKRRPLRRCPRPATAESRRPAGSAASRTGSHGDG